MSIYDIKVKNMQGEDVPLSKYKGKVLLIVNTATKCGFTKQYGALQELYDKYQNQGFEILDFPCNQFFRQAPGTNEEIKAFCELNYQTTFETFSKIDVNGKNEDPLYGYLKSSTPSVIKPILESDGFSGNIKWNFTKFLVDKEGFTIARYASKVKPELLEETIKQALEK